MRPNRSLVAATHASTESSVGDVAVRVVDRAELGEVGDGLGRVGVVDVGDLHRRAFRAGSVRCTHVRCPVRLR